MSIETGGVFGLYYLPSASIMTSAHIENLLLMIIRGISICRPDIIGSFVCLELMYNFDDRQANTSHFLRIIYSDGMHHRKELCSSLINHVSKASSTTSIYSVRGFQLVCFMRLKPTIG
jgi:hypothetical protein